MPEVVTKYPTILIKELKDAGGKCGEGLPAQILKKCPVDRFCVLPTGEICVYDLHEINTMTQISKTEWSEYVANQHSMFGKSNLNLMLLIFAIGFGIGMFANSKFRKANKK